MNKQQALSLFFILFSFIVSIYFYEKIGEKVPIHWNENGAVDGYTSKEVGLFLMPVISIVLYALMILLPRIDPLKENVEKFKGMYEWFVLLLIIFFFALHIFTILWALGNELDVRYVVIPGIAVLLYGAGELMQKSKRNWFIGIRTPWTISNDEVWESTNKLGATAFKVYGILLLVSLFAGIKNILIVIVPLILLVIGLIVYSYFKYKTLEGKKSKKTKKASSGKRKRKSKKR